MAKRILVIGASRGIGAELCRHLSQAGHEVIGVSRNLALNCSWIRADISSLEGINDFLQRLGSIQLDAMIFSCGVWEKLGFTESFDFLQSKASETQRILALNVLAPIEITKQLSTNLAQASNPRAIYLGALSGTEQYSSEQVAYSASKFALRGAIQAMRLALSEQGIGFTVINPGNVATPEVLKDITEGANSAQAPIPLSDLTATVDYLLSLSLQVDVGDINLMQRKAKAE